MRTYYDSLHLNFLPYFHSLSGASWGGSKDYSVEVADKDVASSNAAAAASAQQQQYYLGANLKDPHQLVLMSPIKEISNVVGAGGPSPPPSPSMGSRYTYHHIYSLVVVIISKSQIIVFSLTWTETWMLFSVQAEIYLFSDPTFLEVFYPSFRMPDHFPLPCFHLHTQNIFTSVTRPPIEDVIPLFLKKILSVH